jgi:predicted GIY-YIG superfamily endonuclease
MILYFLQAGEDGPIKIGITKNVEKRIKQLEKEAPYEMKIIATYPGNRDVEKMVHRRFIKFRISNIRCKEWFKPEEELLFWMDNIIITPIKIFFDPDAKFVTTSEWQKKYD